MDPISFFSSSSSNNSIINFDDAFSSLMLDDCDESSLSYAATLERYTNFPLSPPTLIIPSTGASSSSTTTTTNNNSHTTHTKNCTNIGGSNVIETPTRGASAAGCCSGLLYDEMMMMCRSSTSSKNCSTMLKLDADSVMNDWDEYLDNNTNRNHNNSNSSIINNNNHNNYTNNTNTNNVNIRSTDEQDTQDLLNILQNNNNGLISSTHTISQDYLGSVLANCTSIQVSKRGAAIHHSKSPSLGSLNNRGSGIKKGSHQRSNSCYQAISYSNSMMHNNGQPTIGFNMMNVGLSSPSVTSTCSSTIAVSPANVSTNSFANTQHMISNGHGQPYLASVNNQYSTVVNNQPQPSIGSNKKGKIPAHRQDKNQINGKGLLVEANPNDKPIKMKQDKVKELGIKIHFEDGISKNKKDTGLQFHTCSFK